MISIKTHTPILMTRLDSKSRKVSSRMFCMRVGILYTPMSSMGKALLIRCQKSGNTGWIMLGVADLMCPSKCTSNGLRNVLV